MFGFLRRLARRQEPAVVAKDSLAEQARKAADGLVELDAVELGRRIRLRGQDDGFLRSAAAAVGVIAVARHGGAWQEDPVQGVVIASFGGVEGLTLHPEAVVARCLESGAPFDLAKFFETLPPRLAAERDVVPLRSSPPLDWSLVASLPPNQVAADEAARFRAAWRARFEQEIPFTLVGVRELDRFLRSHFLVSRFPEAEWPRAGFYLGEVGRGLFGGDWDFSNARAPHEVALHFPELDYLPIGRIYRMMTERPTGDPLDEYLRLIPSARSELRRQATQSSNG